MAMTSLAIADRGMGEPISLGAVLTAGKKVVPDVTLLLEEDHREAMGYFDWYQGAPDQETKLSAGRKLCTALRVHMQVEEEILYPAARRALGDEEIVDHAEEEHAEARALVEEIERALDAGRPADQAVEKLRSSIEHHVAEEEKEFFPKLRKTDLDFRALGALLAARRAELLFYLTGRGGKADNLKETGTMPIAKEEAQKLFVLGLRDVHATARQGREMLERQLGRLENYPQVEERLRAHLDEKNGQLERLEQVLDDLGESRSALKDFAMETMGNLSAMMTAATSDEIHKNSLTLFGLANFQVASYESLLTLGAAADQAPAVKVLQANLNEERAMAAWLADNLRGLVVMHLQRRSDGLPADR